MVRVSAVAALTVTRAEVPVPILPSDSRDTVGAVMVPDDVMLPPASSVIMVADVMAPVPMMLPAAVSLRVEVEVVVVAGLRLMGLAKLISPVVVAMSSTTVSPAPAMLNVAGMVAAVKLKSRSTVWVPVGVVAVKDVLGRVVEAR